VPYGGSVFEYLDAFLRIPYRKDGAVSDDGRYTVWADPDKTFKSPGLNCSGFMVAAARFLLGANFTLEEGKRDALSDSGKDSPLGEDWDFGLDTALNLAGPGATLFPYAGEYGRVTDDRGRLLGLGADIAGPGFEDALSRLMPGKLYFFAVSKPDRRFKGGLSYYHNGIAAADMTGEKRLYHSTGRAGVHRMSLGNPAGLANFRRYYPPVRGGERRIIFIEAVPAPCGPPGYTGPRPASAPPAQPDPSAAWRPGAVPRPIQPPPLAAGPPPWTEAPPAAAGP
jgi:cell wall-associated NlpC family hydrolase